MSLDFGVSGNLVSLARAIKGRLGRLDRVVGNGALAVDVARRPVTANEVLAAGLANEASADDGDGARGDDALRAAGRAVEVLLLGGGG